MSGRFPTIARRLRAVIFTRWEKLAAAAFGLAYFVSITGLAVLDPRRADLVAAGDLSNHALAHDFAQWDEWRWPVTQMGNYLWPVGTSTVFAGANAWLALVLRVVLPRDVGALQWIGPWLATIFALQGYFGARLAARFTDDMPSRVTAGALFALSPVLAFRLPHVTLCAHFVLLALIDGALTPKGESSKKTLAIATLFITFVAGLHPTLYAMAMPLALVVVVRHVSRDPKSIALVVALVGAPMLVWLAFGNFTGGLALGTVGFGFFSTNILSLVDPQEANRSAFLPPLPHGPGQYEGIAYLGAGVIALVVLGVVLVARARRFPGDRWLKALLATCLVCAVFALSSHIRLGDWLLVDLTKPYKLIEPVTTAFRSSGRFVWPLHYTMIALGVAAATRLRMPWQRVALGLAVVVQLLDGHGVEARSLFAWSTSLPQPSAAFRLARGEYKRMILDPADVPGFGKCPEAGRTIEQYRGLLRIATDQHLTLNSGSTSRFDEARHEAYCASLAVDRRENKFDPEAVYVVTEKVAPDYLASTAMTCGMLDTWQVCVRADRSTALQRLLAAGVPPALPLGSLAAEGLEPPDKSVRWAGARMSLRLPRAAGKSMYFAFVGHVAPADIKDRSVTMRVRADGHELDRVPVRRETFGGTWRVPAGGDSVTIAFELRGALSQTGNEEFPRHVWQLAKVEWIVAE